VCEAPPPYGGGIIGSCGRYPQEENSMNNDMKNSMSDDIDVMTEALIRIINIKEKFARIQENPALYGAKNGLTAEESEILEKLIAISGEAAFAAKEILRRADTSRRD
jgi:hypothetical protein